MTGRGIIFSGPMVRALLAGRKTQTRRLAVLRNGKPNPMTRWQAGDRCYVRESFAFVGGGDPGLLITRADYPACVPGHYENVPAYATEVRWTPSIHMPRWASRLTLTVEQVRIEPLQSISEADAIAEGLDWVAPGMWSVAPHMPIIGRDPCKVYSELWNSLHTDEGTRWDDNPQVVAITFEVARGNIDEVRP